MGFSSTATAAALPILYFLAMASVSALVNPVSELSGSNVEYYQAVNATPELLVDSILSKDVVRCARVPISGLSRLKLGSYSNAHRITLVPSKEIRETSYKKIQICSHKNSSLGLCQCENDNWENIHDGLWSSTISPYEHRYIDVKFVNNLSGSVAVYVKSEFRRWRLLCLGIGIVTLLLAPIVSSWVPFYYSSAMAIGICLVVIILLFQGMKLLPTGRKSALYSTIWVSALGAGSYLLNRFSMFVNSILVNFGISEELHNPVRVFMVVFFVLAGAAFGCCIVRKFIVEDGTVDVGVAQFVKWALRIVGVTFIIQSTLDTPLAMAALASIPGIHIFLSSLKRLDIWEILDRSAQLQNGKRMNKYRRAEFLSRPGTMTPRGVARRNLNSSPGWSNSPSKGVVTPRSQRGASSPEDYYSTFHKTPHRKRFTKEEWTNFTKESTQQAVADLTASPEFSGWIIKNAERIQLRSEDSSDGSVGSGSDSTDENVAQSSSGRGLVWQRRR